MNLLNKLTIKNLKLNKKRTVVTIIGIMLSVAFIKNKEGKYLIQKSSKTQEVLLKKALKLLKDGGELVYSTCSILKEENEQILEKVLKEKNAKILPIEFEGMETLPKLPVNVPGTLCIKPDEYYEGFYVAKLRKK